MTIDPHLGRRRLWIAVAVAAIVLVASVGFNRWRTPHPVPPLGPETATIAPGVDLLRGPGPSAVYVVETSDGPVLIDSGLEADASTLKAEMAKLLIDWRGIKAVLLTHVHGDHVGGAEAIRGKNVDGKKFEDVTISSRTGHLQKGHGISFADYDDDGDLDLFVEAAARCQETTPITFCSATLGPSDIGSR